MMQLSCFRVLNWPLFAAFFILCLAPVLASAQQAEVERGADTIFSELEPSLFQIRIMEKKSGSRSALGTGFLLAGGLVATNYHVVSNKVLEQDNYRIELDQGDTTVILDVVAVDIVSDLAVLKPVSGAISGRGFVLASKHPRKGETLYSLGNPHDLGMIVVQGNYNGPVDHKFLERLHFTGAINSGMSGGPTVNRHSEVVGINVATAGNQIGFLVPVANLVALIERLPDVDPKDLLASMASQIANTTNAMIDQVMESQWPTEPMGDAVILGKTVEWFECWGNSEEDEERNLLEIGRGCNNADSIFISDSVTTGFLEYEFYYLEGKKWPSAAFYRLLAENTGSARAGNQGEKHHMENYDCVNRLIETPAGNGVGGMTRRASYCVRAYKKLPGLYDVFFIGVSVDKQNRAAMDHFTLSGVTTRAAQAFLERFVGVLRWQ